MLPIVLYLTISTSTEAKGIMEVFRSEYGQIGDFRAHNSKDRTIALCRSSNQKSTSTLLLQMNDVVLLKKVSSKKKETSGVLINFICHAGTVEAAWTTLGPGNVVNNKQWSTLLN